MGMGMMIRNYFWRQIQSGIRQSGKGTQCQGTELLIGAPLATRKFILSINSGI